MLPRKQVYAHTWGIECWMNASQASLAPSCLSGKTGTARKERGEAQGGLDKKSSVERE